MRPSGAFKKLLVATPLVIALSGCLYGLHGGGLPSHVHTIAVIPFDNQTPVADVQREISDSLRVRLISRLGLREAPEARASAVVRGTIRRYEAGIPIGVDTRSRSATAVQRALEMVLDIDVIDQTTGKSLWSRKGYLVQGQYAEGQESLGRSMAVDKLVTAIVEGVQSQW
ncbi:MAG TPA: LPS assembly lipoprotein LptE [Gemmatimonadaceae bacterium]